MKTIWSFDLGKASLRPLKKKGPCERALGEVAGFTLHQTRSSTLAGRLVLIYTRPF